MLNKADKFQSMCYETHKPLKIGKYVVHGGSASNPVYEDADIYLSLQSGSRSGLATQPWNEEEGVVLDVLYSIQDCRAPVNPTSFKKMIKWVCNELQKGKKLHVGCVGGHGRTGLVLSALVATLTKEKDAITYVRQNYCKKAVESSEQVDFLVEHFHTTKVKGYKSDSLVARYHDYDAHSWGYNAPHATHGSKAPLPTRDSGLFDGVKIPVYSGKPVAVKCVIGAKQMSPVSSPMSLWKAR